MFYYTTSLNILNERPSFTYPLPGLAPEKFAPGTDLYLSYFSIAVIKHWDQENVDNV